MLAVIIIAAFGIAFVATPMPLLIEKYTFVKGLAKQAINLIVFYRGVFVVTVPFFIMMMGIARFLKNRNKAPRATLA